MNLILFDDPSYRVNLLPLTLVRPIAEIRLGILTLREKWEKYLGRPSSVYTSEYLSGRFPVTITADNLWINGAVCPDQNLIEAVKQLSQNTCLIRQGITLAIRNSRPDYLMESNTRTLEYPHGVDIIDHPWKIFQLNGLHIKLDYDLITKNRDSMPLSDPHTITYGTLGKDIFFEEGACTKAAVLNAEKGPIYLGKNTQLEEGTQIRGPFALCEGAIVNMGAKVRGDSTVGPHSKIGGEISNTVFFGYSNKAHDGFLGNSIVSEWCNIGAGTNASNLKNTYTHIKIWDYKAKKFGNTDLQFCGLIMGDYSVCGINTMFNTGTVVGIGCNIFGSGFLPRFIPSFSWGGASTLGPHRLAALLDTVKKMMVRRGKEMGKEEVDILHYLFKDLKETPHGHQSTLK